MCDSNCGPEKICLRSLRAVGEFRKAEFQVMRGAGCRTCNNTGYKGRIAVYEIMVMTDELAEFVLNGASTLELKREAIRQGMKTLRMSALTKLGEGKTSMEECVRSTAPD